MTNSEVTNLYDCPRPTSPEEEEFFETLWSVPGTRIERIVSVGHSSAPDFSYDQDEDEWVLVLQGHAELELEDGRRVELGHGDWFPIPARCRHRVARTSSEPACIWLAVWAASGKSRQ